LKTLTYSNYEIILVDNGSVGNDVAVLQEQFSDDIKIIINDKNYGFAEGCNIGIRYALHNSSDYCFLLNNDTVINDSQLLDKLVETGESDQRIGIIGPEVRYFSNPSDVQSGFQNLKKGFDPLGRRLKKTFTLDGNVKSDQPLKEMLWILGTAILIKRTVIERIGFLDSLYFCYHEEVDFCLRALHAGFKIIYCPQVSLLHKDSASTAPDSEFKIFYQNRNLIILMHKFLTRTEFVLFIFWRLLVTVPINTLSYLKAKSMRRLKSFLSGTFDGLKIALKAK
jgi:GT2 family glycosyltransferase